VSTAAWAAGGSQVQELPVVQQRSGRPSVLAIHRGVARAGAAAAKGRASDGLDVLGLAAITFGTAQLPSAWGEVCPWVVGGLSALIISAKLSA
jgi:hypothetical protein